MYQTKRTEELSSCVWIFARDVTEKDIKHGNDFMVHLLQKERLLTRRRKGGGRQN